MKKLFMALAVLIMFASAARAQSLDKFFNKFSRGLLAHS